MVRSTCILLLTALLCVGAFSQAKKSKGNAMSTGQATPGGAAKHTAVIATSMGDIEIELFGNDAPKTVENFIKLAEKKYYDGLRFHRIVPGFVIQTGDGYSKDLAKTEMWGTGGESAFGKEFPDELNAATPSYKEGYKHGVVAMANHGPNTNSSQFFICLADVGLPHAYTIFGKVTKGLDIVDKIGAVQTDPRSQRPIKEVLMKSVTVKK